MQNSHTARQSRAATWGIILVLVAVAAAQFTAFSGDQNGQNQAPSGTDGNIDWSIQGDTLTLSKNPGAESGEMKDYDAGDDPGWVSGAGWDRVTKIVILEGVTSVGNIAFRENMSITSVTLPASVDSIGDASFQSTGLVSVDISRNVEYIGPVAFSNCPSLKSITVENGNQHYVSVDGVLFEQDLSELKQYPAARSGDSYTVPDGVKVVSYYAFYGSNLSSVTFPQGLECLREYAFAASVSLRSVVIPDSAVYIGQCAFRGCTSLESAVIPDVALDLQDQVFEDCSSLRTQSIPSGMNHIPNALFSGCSSLASVTLPAGLQYIGYGAFEDCTSFTSVVLPDGVVIIAPGAFSGCSSLASVKMGDKVEFIGEGAFQNCTSLTSMAIPESVTDLGKGVFYNDTALESVSIPSSVTSIPYASFFRCQLKSVEIPSGVTDIGMAAFTGCSLVTVDIPAAVEAIDSFAFADCPLLTAINVSPDNQFYRSVNGVLYSKDLKELLQFPAGKAQVSYSISADVTFIDSNAFSSCVLVQAIDVSGDNQDYSSLDGVLFTKDRKTLLKYPLGSTVLSYSVPEGTEEIPQGAFEHAVYLESVSLPASLRYMHTTAFSYCHSLKQIDIPVNNPVFRSVDGVLYSKDMATLVKYPAGRTAAAYTVPDSVKTIEYTALLECDHLRAVFLPEGLEEIGDSAFLRCTSLSYVNIPDSVRIINADGFGGLTFYEDDVPVDETAEAMQGRTWAGSGTDQKLYDLYAEGQFRIGFSVEEDQTSTSYIMVTSGEDHTLPSLPVAERPGYEFRGWFVKGGTVPVTEQTGFTEDTVLVAKWRQTSDDAPLQALACFAAVIAAFCAATALVFGARRRL